MILMFKPGVFEVVLMTSAEDSDVLADSACFEMSA